MRQDPFHARHADYTAGDNVMCDCYTPVGEPIPTNKRYNAAKIFSNPEKSSLLLAYEVNVVGPVLVIKHMWPFLKAGGRSETDKGFSLVANMSARVGSIGDNVTKIASVELGKKDNIACILLHPGTVDTDLSRPFQKNVHKDKLFTREFSVQKLLSIIDNVKKSDNGKFFAWDGQEIPWGTSQGIEELAAHVDACGYVSIAAQKTGAPTGWRRALSVDTPETAYLKAKLAAESFQPLHIVVCPFRIEVASTSTLIAYP
ncbi:hypothetical protein ABZP36_018163 [Zizania latifolia]